MVFLKLNFSNSFAELSVVEVIKIWFISLIFSNSLIKGKILNNSPTLTAWNQINLPWIFLLEKKVNLRFYPTRKMDIKTATGLVGLVEKIN